MTNQMVLEHQAAEVVDRQHAEKTFIRANDFFYSNPLIFAEVGDSPKPESYANGDGAVQFHLIGHEPQDPKYSDMMNENSSNLLAMGGLVHDYMHRTYPEVNSQKLDINTWKNVIGNLPCLAIGTDVEKEYNNTIVGTKVSGEFLSLIAKAIITDGASLLVDFTSFLSSIQDVVFSVHVTGETYKVLTCTYLNYLVDNGAGGYFDYGAIALRQIDFAENFMEIKSSCSSSDFIKVHLKYTENISLVQTARIRQGGSDYENFKSLIDDNATQAFNNAKNFFGAPKTPQKDLKPV